MTCARIAMGVAFLTVGCSGLRAQSNPDALQLGKPLSLKMDRPVLDIAVSPNGQIVAVGSEAGLQLLRADNLRPISRLDGSKGNAAAIAFSANSKIVATVGEDRHPSFWSADDGRLLNTAIEKRWGWRVEAHNSLLQCLTSGGNPAISKWNMVSGELMQEVQTDFDHMGAITMLPSGKQFISCGVYRNQKSSRYKMELRDYASLKPIRVLQEAKNQVFAMSISPDGSKLGFVTQNGSAEIWDLKSLSPLHETQLDQTKTTKLHFLPDGRSVVVAGWFRKLVVWDFVGGDVRELKYPSSGGLTSMAYLRSPDRLLLGSGQADFRLALAEVQSKGRIAMSPR
ncbi:MAG: WD40 repeat domain-containing protein, partial [Planctomycetota bacterium]